MTYSLILRRMSQTNSNQDGSNRYVTASHSSLVISNNKWIWNQGQVGGISALDYLMKVQNMGFIDAVEHLTGEPAISLNQYPAAPNGNTAKEKLTLLPCKSPALLRWRHPVY